VRTTLPAVGLGLFFTGCVPGPASQPPDPSSPPEPQPTATAKPEPTATDTQAAPVPTPTATEPATPSQPDVGVQRCGSRGSSPCPSDQFCDFKGPHCGTTDIAGTCKTRPQVCTHEFKQVCGCNGQTYSNPCAANAAGVSVKKDGKCDR
jgi:hypothetical protein